VTFTFTGRRVTITRLWSGAVHRPHVHVVLLANFIGEHVGIVRRDLGVGADLDGAVRVGAVEDEQRALGMRPKILRLLSSAVQRQLHVAVIVQEEPERSHLRLTVRSDRRKHGDVRLEQILHRVRN